MSFSHKLKNHLAAFIIRTLGCLPLSWLRLLGYGLGSLFWQTKSSVRKVCETNIATCFPHLTTAEKKSLGLASLRQSAATLLEMMGFWQHSLAYGRTFIKQVHQEFLLDQALAEKKGLLLILPHLGNWELTNHYITQKTPIVALYHPAKLSKVDQLIYAARTRPATKMVPTNRAGVKALYQTLRQGGTVVILPDQEPELSGGCFADFFGVSALTGVLVPRLLQGTSAQCLCIFTLYHAENKKFETYITQPDPAIYDKDLTKATRALNHSIEQCVEKNTAQYQWTYKRFKQRPEGEEKVYR